MQMIWHEPNMLTGQNEWKYENEILFQKVLAAVDALTRTRPGNVKINFIHKHIFGDLQRTLKVCVLFYGQDLTVHFSFWYGTRDALSCFHVCNHHLFCWGLWRLLSHETSCIKHWFDFNPDVLFYGKQVCIIFVPKPAHNRSKYFCSMQRTKTVRVLTAALHATR